VAGRCEKHSRAVPTAIHAFHKATEDVSEGTKRNRRRALNYFAEFVAGRGITTMDQIDLEALNA
jgi:site-specific recombinase XerD